MPLSPQPTRSRLLATAAPATVWLGQIPLALTPLLLADSRAGVHPKQRPLSRRKHQGSHGTFSIGRHQNRQGRRRDYSGTTAPERPLSFLGSLRICESGPRHRVLGPQRLQKVRGLAHRVWQGSDSTMPFILGEGRAFLDGALIL